jgi:cytosine/adenosine deaminase-related metal-dependent hydrolase
MLGTDGLAADILGSGRLMASLFRDARADAELISPMQVLEMATANAARAMGLAHRIGSLEAGKQADIVLHDASLPEWGGPLFDPVGQLAFAAPTCGVHSVWVDGIRRIDAGRATWIDETELAAQVRAAGLAVVARTGLPNRSPWPGA